MNPDTITEEPTPSRPEQTLLTEGLRRIKKKLSRHASITEILDSIVETLQELYPGSIASILLREGRQLIHGSTLNLPTDYFKVIDELWVAEGVGSCGTAAFTGKQSFIEDIDTHPYWRQFRHHGYQTGLKSCWSQPILDGNDTVLGTFTLYSPERGLPNETQQQLLETMAELTAIALEMKLGETNLIESEKRFQMAIQAIEGIGVWDWDIVNDKVYSDRTFARYYGVSDEEAEEGVPIAHFVKAIHPNDRDGVTQLIQKSLQSGGQYVAEYRLKNPQGKITWILAKGECVLKRGIAVRFKGIGVDITERKESEKRQAALFELSERLRDLDDTAYISGIGAEIIGRIFGAKRAGYGTVEESQATIFIEKDWVLDDSIPSVAGLHRFSDYGVFIEDLKQGLVVSVPDVTADLRTAAESENFQRLSLRALLNIPIIENGKLVAVFYLHDSEPHTWQAEEVNFMRLVGDRTRAAMERARSHRELSQINETLEQRVNDRTAELVAVNKELESFSYSVSHDLRAPLRGLSGFSQALAEKYAGTDVLDEEARDYLGFIQKNATTMGNLIDGLLKLSRLNRTPVTYGTVNLSKMATEIVAELREDGLRGSEKRQVTVHIAEDMLIEADYSLLRVALQNLLENAWKFTTRTESAEISFDAYQDNERTIYRIQDNGIGFNMKYYDKLFGAFQRLHKASDFAGTGIGLATVQRIIHRHNGTIWATSEPSQGATFCFTLDRANADSPTNVLNP